MKLKTLKDFDVRDQLVLLLIDVNSPVVSGKIIDNPRFKEVSETIKYLINKKAKLVILAHQGRKGDKDYLDLDQHAILLSKHSGKEIKYVDALFEDKALEEIDRLEMGQALLLKNVRTYDDETDIENSRFYSFAKLFDLYVNDAFSVSHRTQGSVVIPPEVIPSCIGLGLEKELTALEKFSLNSKNVVYLLGGEKIEDYILIFDKLKNKDARLLVSGVLANLFLISTGFNLGYENTWVKKNNYSKYIPILKNVYEKYSSQIILPIDFALGDSNVKKASRKEFSLKDLPRDEKIWDLGKDTIELFKNEIAKSDFLFMKGPLGYAEIPEFSYGTVEILKFISNQSKQKKIFSLLGGGHLSTAIEEYKIPNNFSHISTSGGALISYISGEKLPGIEALLKSPKK